MPSSSIASWVASSSTARPSPVSLGILKRPRSSRLYLRTKYSSPTPGTRLVRVTHPFHPLSGRELVCIGERYNRYGTRLLLRVEDERVYSVPRQWTDVVTADPEVVLSGGRGLLRVADLLELADLVARLYQVRKEVQACKPNSAANVREKTPRRRRKKRH
jgi:hypothetical protein